MHAMDPPGAMWRSDGIMQKNKNFIQPEIRHKTKTICEIDAMGMGKVCIRECML